MAGTQLILLGGGARSGKSGFALGLARRLGRRRLFLATAQPGDAEMAERIQRHQQERGLDFTTVEEPLAVPEVLRQHSGQEVILLDCLTLWLANLLLDGKDGAAVGERVEDLADVLRARAGHVIVVTNEVGMGLVPETALGRTFRDVAGRAHQKLSALADEIYFAVLGTMLRLKPAPAFLPLEEPGP